MVCWKFLTCFSLLTVAQCTSFGATNASELATEGAVSSENVDRLLFNKDMDATKSVGAADFKLEERLFGSPLSPFGGFGGYGGMGNGLGSVFGIPTLSVANPFQRYGGGSPYGGGGYPYGGGGGGYPYSQWPRPRPVYRNYNYNNYRSQWYYNSQAAWVRAVAYHHGRLPNPFEYILAWLGIRSH